MQKSAERKSFLRATRMHEKRLHPVNNESIFWRMPRLLTVDRRNFHSNRRDHGRSARVQFINRLRRSGGIGECLPTSELECADWSSSRSGGGESGFDHPDGFQLIVNIHFLDRGRIFVLLQFVEVLFGI